MPSRKKLNATKEKLSSRLLRTDASGRVVAMAAALTKAAAGRYSGRNVFGIGVARKIKAGKLTDEPCVRLYVVQKIRSLSKIPPSARVPKMIDGVPTDIVEAPPARFHMRNSDLADSDCSAHRQELRRPIYGGISAAHYKVNRTTLGCFCSSKNAKDAGRTYMLSCNHAFANMNDCVKSDPILQPGRGDGGGSSQDGDVAGRLARWVTLHLDGSTPNLVDAAIAEVESGVKVQNEICMIGPLVGTRAARENMPVRKHGCKTGYTEGIVDYLNFDWTIQYGSSNWVHVTKQLHIVPHGYPSFALPGDSGSVVVAGDSGDAVGLYIAGADDGSYGIASPISSVCRALKISIP